MNIQGLVVVYRKELGTGITQTAITIKIFIIFFSNFVKTEPYYLIMPCFYFYKTKKFTCKLII